MQARNMYTAQTNPLLAASSYRLPGRLCSGTPLHGGLARQPRSMPPRTPGQEASNTTLEYARVAPMLCRHACVHSSSPAQHLGGARRCNTPYYRCLMKCQPHKGRPRAACPCRGGASLPSARGVWKHPNDNALAIGSMVAPLGSNLDLGHRLVGVGGRLVAVAVEAVVAAVLARVLRLCCGLVPCAACRMQRMLYGLCCLATRTQS